MLRLWFACTLMDWASAAMPDVPEAAGATAKIRSAASELLRAISGSDD